MISELVLIRSYSTFWKSLFPGGEDYVRLINSSLGKQTAEPIEIDDNPHKRALLNRVSFLLLEKYTNDELSYSKLIELTKESSQLIEAIEKERLSLIHIRQSAEHNEELTDTDVRLIKELSFRLISAYPKYNNITLRPRFSGCGILFEAEGDILYRNTLVEVKAGDRNFGIQDIRQLYVYLALNSMAKNHNILKVELFNPRTGLLWQEYIDTVSENIAGAPTVEIYNEIIDFISNYNRSL